MALTQIKGEGLVSTYAIGSEGGAVTTSIQQGLAKSCAEIGVGGGSLPDSFNISSLDDDGTGQYGLNFTNNMSNSNYSASLTMTYDHGIQNASARVIAVESKTTSSVEIETGYVTSVGIFYQHDIEANANSTNHGDLA
jgi:hypothetical protein